MKDKLRKIYELAKRGNAGEQENAKNLLEKLLKQHNLTLADVVDEETSRHWWAYRNATEEDLLVHIIGKVKNIHTVSFYKYKKEIAAEVTKLQAVEIGLLFDTYRKALAREIEKAKERTLTAFLHANNIFAQAGEEDERPELTAEEIRELMEILRAAQKMGVTPLPRRQLNGATR